MARTVVLACCLALSSLSGGVAFAQAEGPVLVEEARGDPAPVIHMSMENCAAEEAEVRRLLAIELQAEVIGQGANAEGASLVRVICAGDLYRVLVANRDAALGVRTRGLDLRATGARARPRIIALAVVEAMTTTPVGVPAKLESAALPPARGASGEPPPRLTTVTSLRGVGRFFPATNQAAWGLGFGLSRALGERFGIRFELAGEATNRNVALGTVSARTVSVAISPSYGTLFARRPGVMSYGVGVGLRVGLAEIIGEARDEQLTIESSFAAPWAGPTIDALWRIAIGKIVLVDLGADVGYPIFAVSGRSHGQTFGVSGPWIGLHAGVGVRP